MNWSLGVGLTIESIFISCTVSSQIKFHESFRSTNKKFKTDIVTPLGRLTS